MAVETFSPTGPAVATAAERLEELGLALDPSLRYQFDSVFPKVSGLGWKRAIRQKHELIVRIEPVLRTALARRETVLYVAKGVRQSLAEQYLMGIWASAMNQTVFVLTDARLILLRTSPSGRPKRTFWSIYHSQIETFKPSWIGLIRLRLRDGKKLKFTGFAKVDCDSMPGLYQEALARFREHGFDPQVTQSMENLCSYCFSRVPKAEHECGRCGATFWPPEAVALRSLVFPSWGDLCMGHYLLGIMELVGYLFAWGAVAAFAASGVANRQPGELVTAALILAFTHGSDAALTYAIAKKGLNPRRPPRSGTARELLTPAMARA